ncbi:hypothetical protein HIM_12497 [Hirsutella minnesotensis 3608]|uniref:3CxxC-type domain-containing protein n=1 Tax=Hirsutella minnesotensis 3608 TaxID=1043627 RepID=A0A0F7ZHY4_9HYPO|nr:hypothetical protein HIM_12497 [Hirsutella minnesotensis 3608]
MYPKLHREVLRLLQEEGFSFDFRTTDDAKNCIKEWDTNVMGRFNCNNPACSSYGWSSKKIAVTIHMYPGKEYNVRVYHQRCQLCNSPSRPLLDDSYAERTAYRLKKWCGIQMHSPPYFKKLGPPHHSALCEGCRAGHCRELG